MKVAYYVCRVGCTPIVNDNELPELIEVRYADESQSPGPL